MNIQHSHTKQVFPIQYKVSFTIPESYSVKSMREKAPFYIFRNYEWFTILFDHQLLIIMWLGWNLLMRICLHLSERICGPYLSCICVHLSTQPGRKGKAPSTGVTPLCDGGCQNNGHCERHHVPSFSHEDLDECTVSVAFFNTTLFDCISFANL